MSRTARRLFIIIVLFCPAAGGAWPQARAAMGSGVPRGRLAVWEAGAALLDAGRNDEAAAYFEREIARAPGAIELAEGLIEAHSRLCSPDTALAYCSHAFADLRGTAREICALFLRGARSRRTRHFVDAAASFSAAAELAEGAEDTLSASVAARARVTSILLSRDGPAALEAADGYRRLARFIPSDRIAADFSALEAECLGLADRIATADSIFSVLVTRARGRAWREIECRCLSGLAQLDDKRQRNGRALERYRAALELARSMGATERIAAALNGVGQMEVRTGALGGAAVHFKEAEEIAVSCHLEWILGYLYYGYGAVAEARHDRARATKLFQQSLALHRRSGNTWGELGAHLRLGYLRSLLGEYAQAIDHYEFALGYYEKTKSLYGANWALAGLAVAHHRLGDFQAAEGYYERALAVSRELGDQRGAAWALNSLGMLADVQGRYRDALSFEHEAMAIYEEIGDRSGMGAVFFSMGSVYFYLGNYAEAVERYERALAIATELGDDDLLRRVVSGMGSVYSAAGRLDLASDMYERSLAACRRSGDQSGIVWALNNLAGLEIELGEPARARDRLAEALRRLPEKSQNHLRARALYLLARTEEGERSFEYLRRALALADSTGLVELKWRCLSDLGMLFLAAGDTAQAYSSLHRAIVAVESLRRLAGTDELRRHFLEPSIQPYERIVNLILMRSGRAADVKEALSYTERCRAQTLAALLRDAMDRTGTRGDERVIAEERDILSRLAFQQARLQSGALGPDEHADALKRIEALESRFSKLSLEFENGGRPFASALYPRIEQPDELLSALEPGERMLSYFLGERRSYIFSATRAELEVFSLPPRSVIEQRIGDFLGLLQQLARGEAAGDTLAGALASIPALPSGVLDFASAELFDLILGPVAGKLAPGEPLVIVPDGLIGRLPFALLRKDGSYFVEGHDISYAPSLRTLKYLRTRSDIRHRSRHRPAYSVIAIGATGASPGTSPGTPRFYPYTHIPIEPLAGATTEARMVGATFPRSLVLTGRGATETSFKQSPLYDTGMLHIAAHAFVDDADLRRSFIVLNSDEGAVDTLAASGEDGLLQWHEVSALKLNAAVVTLSACQSAGGELSRGEGITGFTQAFLYTGAGSVLASQLDVPDLLARGMMEEFYQGVRRGMRPAAALAAAQRICLARRDALAEPAVWGAFCVIGDGAAAPKLAGGLDAAAVLAIALLVAAGAGVLWNVLRRRRSI